MPSKSALHTDTVIKYIVLCGEVILLNLLYLAFFRLSADAPLRNFDPQLRRMVLLSFCYFVCSLKFEAIFYHRVVRPEQILMRVLSNVLLFGLLSGCLLYLLQIAVFSPVLFLLFCVVLAVVIFCYRLVCRSIVRMMRVRGRYISHVVLVGDSESTLAVFRTMTADKATGYRIVGYFNAERSETYPADVPWLGDLSAVASYLSEHEGKIDALYYAFSSGRHGEIASVVNACENHLVRFFGIPDVRNYLRRRMYLELVGSEPVFAARNAPLEEAGNRFVKRTFDIVVSLLFLCTLFPFIYIFVAIAIKLSSPGPVFFKQKRSGENGREFYCYKFRSMRVNSQSDIVQATKDDPRKTRVGEILRKTSLDELPQFINVLRGEMSIVGPRPHMLRHTEEYRRIIDKYMIRHMVKPGITGWAQVTGFRGETKELWQMEGRVQKDIWYIEHWSFALDLLIIVKTVVNALSGEKEAY